MAIRINIPRIIYMMSIFKLPLQLIALFPYTINTKSWYYLFKYFFNIFDKKPENFTYGSFYLSKFIHLRVGKKTLINAEMTE